MSSPARQAPASMGTGTGGDAGAVSIMPFVISKETAEAARRERKKRTRDAQKGGKGQGWGSSAFSSAILPDPQRAAQKAAAAEAAAAVSTGDGDGYLRLDKWLEHMVAKRRKMSEEKAANGDMDMEDAYSPEGSRSAAGTVGKQLLDARSLVQDRESRFDPKKEGSLLLTEHLVGKKRDRGLLAAGQIPASCHVHSADALREDLEASFSLNLFPGGFSIEGQQEAHPYSHSTKSFLHSLDLGLLPSETSIRLPGKVDFKYYDGCLVAEVRDHRMPRQHDLKPSIHRVVLEPDGVSVTNDLRHAWRCHQNLSLDDILLLERQMLLANHPNVCLDPRPKVAMVSTLLHRRANRLSVWHARPPRPALSEFRRRFDPEALRRMQAAVHAFNRDPNAIAKLDKLAKARAMKGTGISIFEREQQEWEEENPDFNSRMGAMLSIFGRAASSGQTTSSRPAAAPPAPPKAKVPAPPKPAAGAGTAVITPAFFVPPKLLRPGMPPERQMRFRKDSLCASISIQAKNPCCFHVWTRLDEFGADNKIIEGTQVHISTYPIGNAEAARKFGVQQFAIMLRDGWSILFDSHAVANKKLVQSAVQGQPLLSNPTVVLAATAAASAAATAAANALRVSAAAHPPAQAARPGGGGAPPPGGGGPPGGQQQGPPGQQQRVVQQQIPPKVRGRDTRAGRARRRGDAEDAARRRASSGAAAARLPRASADATCRGTAASSRRRPDGQPGDGHALRATPRGRPAGEASPTGADASEAAGCRRGVVRGDGTGRAAQQGPAGRPGPPGAPRGGAAPIRGAPSALGREAWGASSAAAAAGGGGASAAAGTGGRRASPLGAGGGAAASPGAGAAGAGGGAARAGAGCRAARGGKGAAGGGGRDAPVPTGAGDCDAATAPASHSGRAAAGAGGRASRRGGAPVPTGAGGCSSGCRGAGGGSGGAGGGSGGAEAGRRSSGQRASPAGCPKASGGSCGGGARSSSGGGACHGGRAPARAAAAPNAGREPACAAPICRPAPGTSGAGSAAAASGTRATSAASGAGTRRGRAAHCRGPGCRSSSSTPSSACAATAPGALALAAASACPATAPCGQASRVKPRACLHVLTPRCRFIKAHRLLYHSTQARLTGLSRTCVESNKEDKEERGGAWRLPAALGAWRLPAALGRVSRTRPPRPLIKYRRRMETVEG